MATSVDMALDDIIKKNRQRGGGRGRARRGHGSGRTFNGGRTVGAARRGPLSVNARPSQYTIAKPARRIRSLPWQHDLLEDSIRAAGITGVEVGTKLYISNLDYGVSNEDIRELFSEIGELKRYAVHYDRSGRSTGSAEVVYTRRSDAFSALKKYNNVLLDGKPMKIEIVGGTADMPPISARVNVTGVNGRRKRTVVVTPGPGRARGSAPRSRGPGRWGVIADWMPFLYLAIQVRVVVGVSKMDVVAAEAEDVAVAMVVERKKLTSPLTSLTRNWRTTMLRLCKPERFSSNELPSNANGC